MQTKVDGVTITLTDEQVKHIREAKARRREGLNSFEKVLLRFRFKLDMVDKNGVKCYQNKNKGWWAEIYDGNRMWMTGPGLKYTKSFPGGYMYHTPEELITELEGKA